MRNVYMSNPIRFEAFAARKSLSMLKIKQLSLIFIQRCNGTYFSDFENIQLEKITFLLSNLSTACRASSTSIFHNYIYKNF